MTIWPRIVEGDVVSTKLSKDEVKRTDALTTELKKGFAWSANHSTLVVGLAVVFLLVGAGYSIFQHFEFKKEAAAQEKYFEFEKQYLDKHQKFTQSLAQAAAAKKPVASKDKNAKPPAAPTADSLPSGDLAKDYGAIKDGFLSVISTDPRSKGAKMAALHLAEIHVQYNSLDPAIESLKKVDNGSNDLLGAMVKTQLGTLLADKADCREAVQLWDQVLKNKSAEFLHSAVKLKQGLCYESLGDTAKAGEIYSQVKDAGKDSALAKSAEKYLRLMKVK